VGTVAAIALVVFLVSGGWWVYLATGARRWTTERDPLGEPPVKMAALIAAIVIGVALVSTGGGGAEHRSSMEQGLEESSDDLLSGADGASSASAAEAKPRTVEASTTKGASSAAKTAAAPAKTGAAPAKTGAAPAENGDTQTAPAPKRNESTLPSYGKLVVRARKAARARGAEIRWYPTLAAEAREATERRSR
jgi:hypothetical protein